MNTFYAFVQKSSIWFLSLIPFFYVSCTLMRGVGPNVTGTSLLVIAYCMFVLVLCMNLANKWSQLWDMQDKEEREYLAARLN